MDIKDENKRRRDEYRALYAKIPGQNTSEKLDWLCTNLHCTRSTARIWNMRDSTRPIPDAKLKIMRTLLKA